MFSDRTRGRRDQERSERQIKMEKKQESRMVKKGRRRGEKKKKDQNSKNGKQMAQKIVALELLALFYI